jgi:tetrahydromethanopterin S-methyltransferase subunit G
MVLLLEHKDLLITLVTSAGLFVIFLVRQAERVSMNQKSNEREHLLTNQRIDALESKVENLDSEVMKELRRQGESLARIEGHLGVKAKT